MKHNKTIIGLVIGIFSVGFVALASANGWHGGWHTGHMMGNGMMGYGMGYQGHMMDYGHHGYADLSSEDAAKLKEFQDEFYNATQELRDAIQDERLALDEELGKDTPDRAKALELQKELSKLESEFDQKVLAHQLELRKTFPDSDVAMGNGYGGYCWQ